jgi:tetratricopeptide (TPR) repeat protein
LAVWAIRPFWYDSEAARLGRELARARRVLETPGAPVNDLTVLLTNALDRIDRHPESAAELHFLLGSAYMRLAEQVPPVNSAEIWKKSRQHLEQAGSLRVPVSDMVRLRYRVAKAWFHTGVEPARVIDYLTQCIDQADDRFEAYGLLAECYLRLAKPDVRAALEATQKQLQLPVGDEQLLDSARLKLGELLLLLNEPGGRDAARKALSRIGPGASPRILNRARFLRARTFVEDQNWSQALGPLEELIGQRTQIQSELGLVYFWMGLCHQNLHWPTDAILNWEQAIRLGGEPGQAALVFLADTHLRSSNFTEALEEFRRSLGEITKPADFHNSLVSIVQVRGILASACGAYQAAGVFEGALEIARMHARLSGPGAGQVLRGQVAEAWGKATRDKARQLTKASLQQREEEAARQRYKEAGTAFEATADAIASAAEKADWLWRAADCYREGQDFPRVVSTLERFVNLRPIERMSEAWLRLGKAHQALHNDTAAGLSYLRCIESSGLPFAYLARYQLALMARADGKLADAEEILTQNLDLMHGETGEAHENSIFLLGDILFQRQKYRAAALRWDQALALYPTSPSAASARFRLSECYRRLADNEAENRRISEPLYMQEHYHRHYGIWLEQAAANYGKVVDDLEARRMTGSLSETEVVLLRDALFRQAQCRSDQGLYDEAARLYESLASRYQQSFDGFFALKQLYRCQMQVIPLDRAQLGKARATLGRARMMLSALDDSAFHNRLPGDSREASAKWIEDCENELKNLDRQ